MKIAAADRFCGECGFDLNTLAINSSASEGKMPSEPSPPVNTDRGAPRAERPMMPEGRNQVALGSNGGGGHKNALMIVVALLVVLFLAGGGIYWWLPKGEGPEQAGTIPGVAVEGNKNNINTTAPAERQTGDNVSGQFDLSRAATYLSTPGLKCTFYVKYPNGLAGIVDRISGQAVSNEAVRVSEVEVGIERGEEYGFGFHYVERADGTYYILDVTPHEIFPVLKNNLTVGQTWNYQNEMGSIIWTVLDMGVDLDLGFAKFTDCLLIQEDNQAVGWQAITYYAPGCGSVLVISPSGGLEYYKMTAMEQIDLGTAGDSIRKWCPNYQDIKDDRTQTY